MLLSVPRIVCMVFVKYLAFTLLVLLGDIGSVGFQLQLDKKTSYV